MNNKNIKLNAKGQIIGVKRDENSFWVSRDDFEAGLRAERMGKPVTWGSIMDGLPDIETYNKTIIEEKIKKTVIRFDYNKPSLLTKLMLFFIPRHTETFDEVGGNYLMQYKIYRGVIYVLKFELLPPNHPNCKCDIYPEFKGGVQRGKN